jgi:predicted nucleic acid-binding protein
VILVDASVLIDHTRGLDPKLAGLFATYPVALCGVTRAEVLHGARNPGERAKLIAFLGQFTQLPFPDTLWDTVGDNLAVFRSKGLTVPMPDAIVATLALVNDFEAWARDQHFTDMQKFIPTLKLFQEPP